MIKASNQLIFELIKMGLSYPKLASPLKDAFSLPWAQRLQAAEILLLPGRSKLQLWEVGTWGKDMRVPSGNWEVFPIDTAMKVEKELSYKHTEVKSANNPDELGSRFFPSQTFR